MKFALKNKRRWAFYGLILVSLTALIIFVTKYPVSSFDYYITQEVQKIKRGNFFEVFMTWVSVFGGATAMICSVIFTSLLFYWANYRRESRFVLAALVCDGLNLLVKLLIKRPRPTVDDAVIMLKFQQPAFPSGHVVHYVVFFGFLLTVMIQKNKIPRAVRIFTGTLSIFLILSVSISRIYLGAHWATDVMGAYLFGIFYLAILLTFYLRIPEEIPKIINDKLKKEEPQ